MFRKIALQLGFLRSTGLIGLLCLVGCQQTKQHNLQHPQVEEFNPPPDEARYNNPPEDRYRKPHTIKDQAGQLGSNGSMGFDPSGGMGMGNGGGGMGGPGMRR
jgi:hypothetical protein